MRGPRSLQILRHRCASRTWPPALDDYIYPLAKVWRMMRMFGLTQRKRPNTYRGIPKLLFSSQTACRDTNTTAEVARHVQNIGTQTRSVPRSRRQTVVLGRSFAWPASHPHRLVHCTAQTSSKLTTLHLPRLHKPYCAKRTRVAIMHHRNHSSFLVNCTTRYFTRGEYCTGL